MQILINWMMQLFIIYLVIYGFEISPNESSSEESFIVPRFNAEIGAVQRGTDVAFARAPHSSIFHISLSRNFVKHMRLKRDKSSNAVSLLLLKPKGKTDKRCFVFRVQMSA